MEGDGICEASYQISCPQVLYWECISSHQEHMDYVRFNNPPYLKFIVFLPAKQSRCRHKTCA